MSNVIYSRVTNNTSPALSNVTGIVVGQLGVPFPPNVSTPGNRRGLIAFQNCGSGSIFITPIGPNLQNASQFTSPVQGIELSGGLTPPAVLYFKHNDDRWAALSGTGTGDDLRIWEET
jgi:hypothetical protein